MSSRAENWAWERDDVKGITKFVLVYLARRAYYDDGRSRVAERGDHRVQLRVL